MATTASGTDYFTIEVIQQALAAMGDEMFTVLRRTAHSPLIFETLDCAVGATDANGEIVAMGNGITGFLGTLDAAVRDVITKYAKPGNIAEGDIYILNTPYEGGGSHLSDVSLIMPVFDAGRIVGYVVNKAHWTEVGGMDPGSVTTKSNEIYQEGLHFPNVRLCERGRMNDAVIEMIRANVRMPDMTIGDMWAGISALRMGETRLKTLIAKYGRVAVEDAMVKLLDYGEAMARRELKKLPKGTFRAKDYLDNDGLGNGPFELMCAITITDDEFICDFTGSHPQVTGSINATFVNLCSRARALFRAVTTPHVPTNGGMYRPLKVICPPGTIVSAMPPAACSTYFESAIMALDIMWKAVAQVIPERLSAGNLASTCQLSIGGRNPKTGDMWMMFGPFVGGWGAERDHDGGRGQFSAANGQTFNVPVEITEARYGIEVEQYTFHTESGGAGEFRGGNGVHLDYRIVADTATLGTGIGRYRYPPWGVAGGRDGTCSYAKVIHRDGSEEIYGKESRIPLVKGDLVRLSTATGAGYGDPRKRSRARIESDLKNGYITAEEARQTYGIEGLDVSAQ
ncbi:MAG: hydantoinase B/oxoprolinase family protein [Rhodospirillales bacterium]|nr:hydantoinase B/oxoprolinase family protein [Rhodospirillales bacterium]